MPERRGLDGALSSWKGQVDNTSLPLPQPMLGTLGSLRHSNPHAGSVVPKAPPLAHCWHPTGPSSSFRLLLVGRGRYPSILGSISAQPGRYLQEPDPRAPSLWVSKPGAVCWACVEPHISLCTPLNLQPCHCFRASRGQPCPQHSSKDFCT